MMGTHAWAWMSVAALLAGEPAHAQMPAERGEIRGLTLGLEARSMRLDGFVEFACGSNGGPPRQRLEVWADYGKCRPEDSGLHEVYARFDDEDEYIGKAIEDQRYARGKIGTRIAGHPVILSVLFDRGGVVRGFRFVTDARAAVHERRMAHMLRLAVFNRYDPGGWACTNSRRPRARRPSAAFFSSCAVRRRPRSGTCWSNRAFCASRARATTIPSPASTGPASSRARRASRYSIRATGSGEMTRTGHAPQTAPR